MEEKVIKIESINPKDFFGPQNKNIKVLKNNFPNVKIVARGSQIKAYGNSEDLSELEIRIHKIINYFLKYNILSDNEIETLLTKSDLELETSSDSHKPILVARALINEPSIILADEPSGNLDSNASNNLHELFLSLRKDFNYTFIIATHNKLLAKKSDRVLEIKDGKIK